ncbi:unnamed protein product [Adineta ricciae]|nr:unnamed protein product [Adineta ricciae]
MEDTCALNDAKHICNRPTFQVFPSLFDLSPKLLHHIFDYCDTQTILRSIRCVCRKFYNSVNIYNRFELKYPIASNWNLENLAHAIQLDRFTSLFIFGDPYKEYFFSDKWKMPDRFNQFMRLRSLTFYHVDCETVESIVKRIPTDHLTSLSIYTESEETYDLQQLRMLQCNLRKFAMNGADIQSYKEHISGPITDQLVYLEVGLCRFAEYVSFIHEMPHLRTLIIKDCLLDENYQDKINELSQSHTSLLKSLTMKKCSAFLEELESLFSLTPILNHLELIFNGCVFDSPLDGHHLAQILKTRLPLLNDFRFFFSYCYLHLKIPEHLLINTKPIITPFQTPFWLEEKHWYVTCEHIYSYDSIVLYTTPILPVNEDYIDYIRHVLYKLGNRFSKMPSRQRRSVFQNNPYPRASPLDKAIRSSDCRQYKESGPERCKISIKDNICQLSYKFFDHRTKDETPSLLDFVCNGNCDNRLHDIAVALAYGDTFSVLDLSNKGIKDTEVQYLANALRHNKTLKILNLSKNQIGDLGFQYLLESLEQHTTFTSLNINGNQIGHFALKYLLTTLRHVKTFVELNLGSNQIGDKGTEILVDILQNPETSLTTLIISNNQITIYGVQILSDVLRYNKTLIKLDLSHNQINARGAQHLATALEFNNTLTHLNLSNSLIEIEGIKYFSNLLQENKTLTKLLLANNEIGDVGIQYSSDVLRNNTALTTIDFSDNSIGYQGVLYFIDAVKMNKALKTIHFGGNAVSDEISNEFKSIQKKQNIQIILRSSSSFYF